MPRNRTWRRFAVPVVFLLLLLSPNCADAVAPRKRGSASRFLAPVSSLLEQRQRRQQALFPPAPAAGAVENSTQAARAAAAAAAVEPVPQADGPAHAVALPAAVKCSLCTNVTAQLLTGQWRLEDGADAACAVVATSRDDCVLFLETELAPILVALAEDSRGTQVCPMFGYCSASDTGGAGATSPAVADAEAAEQTASLARFAGAEVELTGKDGTKGKDDTEAQPASLKEGMEAAKADAADLLNPEAGGQEQVQAALDDSALPLGREGADAGAEAAGAAEGEAAKEQAAVASAATDAIPDGRKVDIASRALAMEEDSGKRVKEAPSETVSVDVNGKVRNIRVTSPPLDGDLDSDTDESVEASASMSEMNSVFEVLDPLIDRIPQLTDTFRTDAGSYVRATQEESRDLGYRLMQRQQGELDGALYAGEEERMEFASERRDRDEDLRRRADGNGGAGGADGGGHQGGTLDGEMASNFVEFRGSTPYDIMSQLTRFRQEVPLSLPFPSRNGMVGVEKLGVAVDILSGQHRAPLLSWKLMQHQSWQSSLYGEMYFPMGVNLKVEPAMAGRVQTAVFTSESRLVEHMKGKAGLVSLVPGALSFSSEVRETLRRLTMKSIVRAEQQTKLFSLHMSLGSLGFSELSPGFRAAVDEQLPAWCESSDAEPEISTITESSDLAPMLDRTYSPQLRAIFLIIAKEMGRDQARIVLAGLTKALADMYDFFLTGEPFPVPLPSEDGGGDAAGPAGQKSSSASPTLLEMHAVLSARSKARARTINDLASTENARGNASVGSEPGSTSPTAPASATLPPVRATRAAVQAVEAAHEAVVAGHNATSGAGGASAEPSTEHGVPLDGLDAVDAQAQRQSQERLLDQARLSRFAKVLDGAAMKARAAVAQGVDAQKKDTAEGGGKSTPQEGDDSIVKKARTVHDRVAEMEKMRDQVIMSVLTGYLSPHGTKVLSQMEKLFSVAPDKLPSVVLQAKGTPSGLTGPPGILNKDTTWMSTAEKEAEEEAAREKVDDQSFLNGFGMITDNKELAAKMAAAAREGAMNPMIVATSDVKFCFDVFASDIASQGSMFPKSWAKSTADRAYMAYTVRRSSPQDTSSEHVYVSGGTMRSAAGAVQESTWAANDVSSVLRERSKVFQDAVISVPVAIAKDLTRTQLHASRKQGDQAVVRAASATLSRLRSCLTRDMEVSAAYSYPTVMLRRFMLYLMETTPVPEGKKTDNTEANPFGIEALRETGVPSVEWLLVGFEEYLRSELTDSYVYQTMAAMWKDLGAMPPQTTVSLKEDSHIISMAEERGLDAVLDERKIEEALIAMIDARAFGRDMSVLMGAQLKQKVSMFVKQALLPSIAIYLSRVGTTTFTQWPMQTKEQMLLRSVRKFFRNFGTHFVSGGTFGGEISVDLEVPNAIAGKVGEKVLSRVAEAAAVRLGLQPTSGDADGVEGELPRAIDQLRCEHSDKECPLRGYIVQQVEVVGNDTVVVMEKRDEQDNVVDTKLFTWGSKYEAVLRKMLSPRLSVTATPLVESSESIKHAKEATLGEFLESLGDEVTDWSVPGHPRHINRFAVQFKGGRSIPVASADAFTPEQVAEWQDSIKRFPALIAGKLQSIETLLHHPDLANTPCKREKQFMIQGGYPQYMRQGSAVAKALAKYDFMRRKVQVALVNLQNLVLRARDPAQRMPQTRKLFVKSYVDYFSQCMGRHSAAGRGRAFLEKVGVQPPSGIMSRDGLCDLELEARVKMSIFDGEIMGSNVIRRMEERSAFVCTTDHEMCGYGNCDFKSACLAHYDRFVRQLPGAEEALAYLEGPPNKQLCLACYKLTDEIVRAVQGLFSLDVAASESGMESGNSISFFGRPCKCAHIPSVAAVANGDIASWLANWFSKCDEAEAALEREFVYKLRRFIIHEDTAAAHDADTGTRDLVVELKRLKEIANHEVYEQLRAPTWEEVEESVQALTEWIGVEGVGKPTFAAAPEDPMDVRVDGTSGEVSEVEKPHVVSDWSISLQANEDAAEDAAAAATATSKQRGSGPKKAEAQTPPTLLEIGSKARGGSTSKGGAQSGGQDDGDEDSGAGGKSEDEKEGEEDGAATGDGKVLPPHLRSPGERLGRFMHEMTRSGMASVRPLPRVTGQFSFRRKEGDLPPSERVWSWSLPTEDLDTVCRSGEAAPTSTGTVTRMRALLEVLGADGLLSACEDAMACPARTTYCDAVGGTYSYRGYGQATGTGGQFTINPEEFAGCQVVETGT